MVALQRLVAFDLRSRIDMAYHSNFSEDAATKMALDTIVYGEVDSPCRKIA